VLTGGARSGKSRAAQRLAVSRQAEGVSVVVAVFARNDFDDAEMTARIECHRADRPEGFATLEAQDSDGWLAEVPTEALLVVDCLGTLLGLALEEVWRESAGQELGQAGTGLPAGLEAAYHERADAIVSELAGRMGDTIVVTNEVGMSVVPEYASARLFRDALGRANAALVSAADVSYLAVAGRLLELTGLPREAHWPVD
jgi:adenosylcobinamide kinase/adenosylcobinamide-phosphate guanylyltransferase